MISKQGLIQRLERGPKARAKFVDSRLCKDLAFQIRSLRDNGGLSQGELAERVGTNQNAISRLENPYYGKATLTTLKRIAAAFDVGLVVQFVPFSQLVNRVSGTPYIEYGLSPETMNVPNFEEEEEHGVFDRQADVAVAQPTGLAPAVIHLTSDLGQLAWTSVAGQQNLAAETQEMCLQWLTTVHQIGTPRSHYQEVVKTPASLPQVEQDLSEELIYQNLYIWGDVAPLHNVGPPTN